MAELLIHALDPLVIRRLQAQAAHEGRTLEEHARAILERAAGADIQAAREAADRIRRSFGGRRFDDSAKLIRADRER